LDLSSNARFHAVKILTEFDRRNQRLSDISRDYFYSHSFPPQILSTVTYLVQETTRWRGYLDYLLSKRFHGRFHKIEYLLQNILRLGLYEILFREHVPKYASVNEAVELARLLMNEKASGIVNAILRQIHLSDRPSIEDLKRDDPLEKIAAITSHPEWIIQRWLHHFGFDNTLKLCAWNNKIPTFTIRRNRMKVTRRDFESFLDQHNIQWNREVIMEEFYSIDQVAILKESREFEMGYFSIQDLSAGLVTLLLDVESSSTILDVCAAPGGKATHLAERLGNKSTIYAYDSDVVRLQRLGENIERLGLSSIRVAQQDATQDRYPMADVILLDAPCTGTGVMAKRADLRWRRMGNHVEEMRSLQIRILSHMSAFVEEGGKIVYATCSLEPEENWGVIDIFLKKNHHFRLKRSNACVSQQFIDIRGALHTYPPDHGLDGVFAVILERTE